MQIIAVFAFVMSLLLIAEARATYPVPVAPVYRIRRGVDLDNGRVQRQAGGDHHHDVVDFGAHTGHHGAFGWYADFPVHANAN